MSNNKYIERKCPQPEIGQHVYFNYDPSYSYTELKFETPQDEPCTGWSIQPHIKPCRVSECISVTDSEGILIVASF